MGESRPGKQDVARALLVRGSMFVYLDPRREEVSVPPWFRKQPQLVLQFGLQLPVPIPDMRVDEDGVFGTLSFNRQPFACHVPWSGVFALVGDDGMGMVWEEDLPEEIAAEVEAGFGKKQPKRPALRAIAGGRDGSESSTPEGAAAETPPTGDGPRAVIQSAEASDPTESADGAGPGESAPPASEGASETVPDEPPSKRPSAPHLRLIK